MKIIPCVRYASVLTLHTCLYIDTFPVLVPIQSCSVPHCTVLDKQTRLHSINTVYRLQKYRELMRMVFSKCGHHPNLFHEAGVSRGIIINGIAYVPRAAQGRGESWLA